MKDLGTIGKTRLALELVRGHQPPGTVALVERATTSDHSRPHLGPGASLAAETVPRSGRWVGAR